MCIGTWVDSLNDLNETLVFGIPLPVIGIITIIITTVLYVLSTCFSLIYNTLMTTWLSLTHIYQCIFDISGHCQYSHGMHICYMGYNLIEKALQITLGEGTLLLFFLLLPSPSINRSSPYFVTATSNNSYHYFDHTNSIHSLPSASIQSALYPFL